MRRLALALGLLFAAAAPSRAFVTCAVGNIRTVPGTDASITAALGNIPQNLAGPWCVNITDSGNYAEQVTVQNFVNNGSSITIQAMPGQTPTVVPPLSSTAAFHILNDSVNVLGIRMVANQAIPYGVWASSAYVQLSSVSVSTAGALGIYEAGVRISSWSAISYSSVTLGDAHGYWLDRATMTAISFSSAVNNSTARYPVYLEGGKNNAFSVIFASNSHTSGKGLYAAVSDTNTVTQSHIWGGVEGVRLDSNSAYNTISLSTMIGKATNGLTVNGTDSNTVTQSYLWGGQSGVFWALGSNGNTISLSTMIGNANYGLNTQGESNAVTQSYMWGGQRGAYLSFSSDLTAISLSTMIGGNEGLYANGSDSNTVTQSYMWGGSRGAYLDNGSDYNVISLSTAAANSSSGYALFLNASVGNTISQSLFTHTASTAVYLTAGSNSNTISRSTMTGGANPTTFNGSSGLVLDGVSTNTIVDSVMGGSGGNSSGNQSPGGHGLYITGGSSNTVTRSIMSGGGGSFGASGNNNGGGPGGSAGGAESWGGIGLYLHATASNTISQSFMAGGGGGNGAASLSRGHGLFVYASSFNAVSQSTMSGGGGGGGSPGAGGGGGGTVSQGGSGGSQGGGGCCAAAPGSHGVYISTASAANTISQSFLYGGGGGVARGVNAPGAGGFGLYITASSGNVVSGSIMSGGGGAGGNDGGSAGMGGSSSGGGFGGAGGTGPAGDGGVGARLASFATFNLISQSTMSGGRGGSGSPIGVNAPGAFLSQSSTNTISQSYIFSSEGIAAKLAGGAFNTISGSTLSSTSNDPTNHTLVLTGSSSNTISQSFISRSGPSSPKAVRLELQSNGNSIISSTITAPGSALTLDQASTNTISLSYISNNDGSAVKFTGGGFNAISGSTIIGASGSAMDYALHLVGSSSNTIDQSLISRTGPGGPKAAYIELASNGNAIAGSSITAPGDALTFDGTSSNTVVGSYLSGFSAAIVDGSTGTRIAASRLNAVSSGYGLRLKDGSNSLTVSASTMTTGVGGVGFYSDSFNGGTIEVLNNFVTGANCSVCIATTTVGSTVWIASNTIIPPASAVGLQGLSLDGLSYGATIQNNNIYFRSGPGAGGMNYRAMHFVNSVGLVVERNRINQPGVLGAGIFTGARFNNVHDSSFKFNDVHSSGTVSAGSNMLEFFNSTVSVRNNVFLSSMTGAGVTVVNADVNSGLGGFDYNVFYSSNSTPGLDWGGVSHSFPWNATAGIDRHSTTGNPLWAQTIAGLEDFHPKSTVGRFNPATQGFVADSVDSPSLDYGESAESFALEPVPNGGAVNPGSYGNTVEASKSPTLPCPVTRKVCKNGACPFVTIQSAVDNLPSPLPGYSCVYIEDGSIYNERVLVEGIATAGSSITISLDPALTVRPYVRPNFGGAFAGFIIRNSSVNISNINVSPTFPVNYGIVASSANVSISSVHVEGTLGPISFVGIALSSWSSVSYSSVNVGDAHGFRLEGATGTAVSYSTAINNSAASYPVYLQGGKNNNFTTVFASNSHVSGYALYAQGSDTNTVTQSFLWSGLRGVQLDGGSDYNTITLSTMVGNDSFGLWISASDSNTVTQSYMRGISNGARLDGGADYNTISLSTMIGDVNYALYNGNSDSNLVTQCYMRGGSYGAYVDVGSDYNTVSLSTMIGNSLYGFYAVTSDSNTVTQSYLWGAQRGAWLDTGADDNSISLSTMVSINASGYGLYVSGADRNTVTGSYMRNFAGDGAIFIGGSDDNVITLSTMASDASSMSALTMTGSDRNTVTRSYIWNPQGNGAFLSNSADFTTISQSTVVTNTAGGGRALYINDGVNNTVTGSFVTNLLGDALYLNGGANFTTVSFSTMISNAVGYVALNVTGSSTNTVWNSYIQGSTAALVNASTGTVINSSWLVAVDPAGKGLTLRGGSVNLTVSSSTLRGGPSGRGLRLEDGNTGVISVGSVTVTGSARGLEISAQAPKFVLAVDSITFRSLTAGATAIHYLGGTFRSTFTLANFEDATVGANVSGAALDTGSRITMFAHYGERTGPTFENDPNGFVGWEAVPQPGCVVTRNVGQGQPYETIAAGLAALPQTLTGHSCVVVRDTQTYSGQVTVEGFINNGSSITIMADPSFVSSAPVVSFSGAGAAGFMIKNASVNVRGFTIRPTAAFADYGVHSSSAYVTISSVSVESSSFLNIAGVVLSDRNTLAYSTVSAGSAHGVRLDGNFSSISNSSITNNSGGAYALYIAGRASNTVTQSYISNDISHGVRLESGANGNAISLSTMTSGGGVGIFVLGSESNTVTSSYMGSAAGVGVHFLSGSSYNTITLSVMASNSSGGRGLSIFSSSWNTVTQSFASNPQGYGAYLNDAHWNTVSQSTITGTLLGGFVDAAAFKLIGSSNNAITQDYIQGMLGHGLFPDSGSNANTISGSTIVTGTSNTALYVRNSSSNTFSASSMHSPGGGGVQFASLSRYNAVSFSTVVVDNANDYALKFNDSDWNSVTDSYLSNASGSGVRLEVGSDYNSISLSTMSSNVASRYALEILTSANNAVTRSVITNPLGHGARLLNADYNAIGESALTSNSAGHIALDINAASTNTVSRSFISNPLGTAVYFEMAAAYNLISQSTITSVASGFSALHITGGSSTNTVQFSYIQGSTAAIVSESTGTVINSSVLVATNTIGSALVLSTGSLNLTVASTTLRGGPFGRGFLLNDGNRGTVSIGSVTVTGSARGLEISTQAAGFVLTVDSVTFRDLTLGATAIHYLGGTFRSTFTLANFEDATVGANVSAAALDPASRVTMFAHYGERTGSVYENDPNQLVGWQAGSQPGCVVTNNVGAGQPYGSIQAGINALPQTLTGHSCVVIRDGATYPEYVVVSGFTNNGSSITIMSDPASSTVTPRVTPPFAGAAAFNILNSSVNLIGIEVRPSFSLTYGIFASSTQVTISSVIVNDPAGSINTAGISVSSWSAVAYASVTVGDAYGFLLRGSTMTTLSYSTATNNTGTKPAVLLDGARANTIIGLTASNRSDGGGLRIDFAGFNTVSQSSFSSIGNSYGLMVYGSSFNAISTSRMFSPGGHALRFEYSYYNSVSQSTAASSGLSKGALYLNTSSTNAFSGIVASNPQGFGAYFTGSSSNTLSLSTFTNASFSEFALYIANGASNTISGSYIANSDASGVAAYLSSTSSTTLSQCTIVGGNGNYGLKLNLAGYNRIEGSTILTGAQLSAGSNNNFITGSALSHNNALLYGLELQNASSNTVTQSFASNPLGYAAALGGGLAHYNTISQSTITSVSGSAALYLSGSGNVLVSNYIANGSGYAVQAQGANYGAIQQSTITNSSALVAALHLASSSSNTVTNSVIVNGVGDGVYLTGANWNALQESLVRGGLSGVRAQSMSGLSVSLSSVTGGSSGASAGIWGDTYTDYITIANSYVQGSTGVYLNGSSRAVVTANVLAASGGGSGFFTTGYSQTLALSANTVLAGGQAGIGVDLGSGTIRLSTNTVIARGGTYGIAAGGLAMTASLWITSNTIVPSLSASATTYGVFLNQLPGGATVQNNGIYYRTSGEAFGGLGAGAYGLYASQVSGLKIDHNRISNPSMIAPGNYIGAAIDSTSGAYVRFNDLYSTGGSLTTFNLLRLTGSPNASVRNNILSSSMTATANRMIVVDVVSQSGFSSDYNTYFSSNASYSGVWGVGAVSFLANWIATTGRDASSLSSNPRWVNPAGEDFHPLSREGRWNGAAFVQDAIDSPIIDRADPAEVIGLEVQPNGARANQGSYGQAVEASQTVLPCPVTRYVRQGGDGDSTTIQGGIAALPNPIVGGHSCVIIGDSGIYDEAVTVQGFTNNGSSITIMLDPSLTVHPIVRQGFVVKNASVNVVNIDVAPTGGIAYGIFASSANILISSVNVNESAGGTFSAAGVALSSYSALANSIITVGSAHGLRLDGKFAAVSYSTMTSNSGAFYALFSSGADSNTVTQSYISNPLGGGARLAAGSDYNTISLSTITNNIGTDVALMITGSDFNTVAGSFVSNPGGYGANLEAGADNNAISQSTIAAGGAGSAGLYAVSSDSNTVTGSLVTSAAGIGLFLDSGADYNTVNQSTATSAAGGVAALDILAGRFNAVTGSYLSNPAGYGAVLAGGAQFNTISLSTMVSDTLGNMALYITASDSNTVTGSYMTNPSGAAARLEIGADYNTISQSRLASDASGSRALDIAGSDFNSVAGTFISNPSGEGARLSGGADFNTISNSTVTSNAAGLYALVIADSSSNTVRSSYVQGSTAAVVSNSTGTVLNSSVLVASGASGSALSLRGGASGLSMSSNTVVAGAQGIGLYLEDGNSGSIVLSTNTVYGGRYGLYIATQAAGTTVWIASNTVVPAPSTLFDTYGLYLRGLTSGATIQNNGVYYRSPADTGGFYTAAVEAQLSAGLVIAGNRFSNPGMISGRALGVGLMNTPNTLFTFNDVHSTAAAISSAYHMRLINSPGAQLRGNIFSSSWSVTGSSGSLFVDAASVVSFVSDYNDFFSSNSYNSIEWGGSAVSLPFPWTATTGQDGNSIAKHPRWKNPSSGGEDFHLLSQAGRWDGAAFVNDGFTSALIDKADPASAFVNEAAPNGGRANLGSYGNTAEASKTPQVPTASAVAEVFASSISFSYGLVGADGYMVIASTASNFTGTQYASATANGALALLAPQGLAANTTHYLIAGAVWGDFNVFAGQLSTSTLANSPAPRDPAFGEVNISSLTAVWLPNGPTVGIGTYTVVLTTGAAYPNSFAGNHVFSTATPFNLGTNTPPAATRLGLAQNTTYHVFVAALNWNSMPSSFTLVGSTPTLADMPATAVTTFTSVGFSSFSVSWGANGNPLSITTYTVQLSTASDFNAFATSVTFSTVPALGPSATFTGLGANELYYFRVSARNHQGVETPYAVLGSTLTRPVTLQPPAIAGFVAVHASSITATWGLSALATGYTLVASLTNDPTAVFASSAPVGINATTATVFAPALNPNTTYYLFVQANGPGAATAFSAYPATSTLADSPAAAAVAFSGVQLTSMTVSWLPGGNPVGVTSYTVVLSTGNVYPNSFFGNRAVSTAPAGAVPTATVLGLNDNTLYYLHVAGVNHGGFTSSFTALGSTVTRISAPSTVVFDEISSNTIVASAYAPTPFFANLGVGQSGTQISRNGTYQPVHGEQWVSTTALPSALSEAGAAGFNSLVYVFGGVNGAAAQNAARVYDPATNVWSSLPNISSSRYGIGGAAAGGRIYAVGGTPDGGASLTVNEEYDPVTNTWATKTVLPAASDHLSAVGVGGAVYAFGGVTNGTETDQTAQFDPATNAWTNRPVLPVARARMAAAAAAGSAAGKLAAAGGNGPTNAAYSYDTAANVWSAASFMPAALEQGAAASLGGKIFVIGGALAAQSVYEYDPAVDTWTVRASMLTGRAGLSAVAAGGHIYALGGSADGGATSLTVNEAYDPGVATRFSGLTPNTLVNFRARARGQAGTLSAQTAIVSTYTLAALPGAVAPAFTVVEADSVTFVWALNGNPGGTEFKARASTSSVFGGGAAVLSSDWSAMTSTAALALTPNTTYFFQSAARNGIGGVPGIQTAWVLLGSTATLAAVPAAAPTPYPSAATNGLTVSWLPNGNPPSVTTYTVVVSTDSIYPNVHAGNFTIASTQPAGGLPTATFTGLLANTTYFAFASAVNWNGLRTAYAALGSTSTLALPPAVAAPTFAAVHESSATFSWLPNGNPINVTTYSVVLSTGGAYNTFFGNVVVSTLPAGALPTATVLAGLVPNTTYYGYAAAINSNGAASAYTLLGSTATLAAAPATAVTTFTAVEIGSITVSWSANGNPLALSSYTVQLSTDSFATIAVSFTTAPAAGPSATFTGLDDYKDYFFRVRAVNHPGTATGFVNLGSTRTLLAPLAVPVLAGFVSVDITSITATWGLVSGATGYTLIASTMPVNPPADVAASSTTFAIAATTAATLLPALAPNTTYFLFVRANGNLRSSLFAAYGATSTLATPPATVVSTFTGVGITSFTVSWSANGNALAITTYTVQLSTAPDFNAFATSVTFTTAPVFGPSTMITGLTGNTSYYFRVRALNFNGVPSAYVNLGSTLTVASPLFPTILNSQTGDAVWRRANTALYSTAFLDTSGAHLDKFQVKASTTAAGLGTDIAPFTDVVIGLLPADNYNTPWSLPASVFNSLLEGVTNYITVKVFNGPPLNNFTVLQDAFYVQKDTTSPVIVNTQAGDAVPRSSAGTTYTVGVRDPSSGLAAFQYSASLSPVAANAEIIAWTDIAVVANTTSYTTPWPVDFAQLVSGVTNYISVRSWDVAGATTTSVAAFYVHKDTTGPSVAIATPQDGSFNSSLGQLSGTAASIYGVQGTEVSILDMTLNLYWNPAGPAFNSVTPILIAASGTAAWTLAPGITWIDGRTYKAVARSSTTANIYSTIYATSTFVMDLSTPAVGVLAPAPNSTVAVLPQISGTAADPAPNPSGLSTVEVRLRRNADGLWWNWFAQSWGVTAVSSVTAGTTAWSLTPTPELKASLDDGASYFIAVRASDNALPSNAGDFFVSGATFTWQDATPPSAVADLAASHGSAPGRINLSWTAPGDDAGVGPIALGEYRIFYSTDIAAVASTSAAQVVIATAAVYPGAAQFYTIVGLNPGTTYYVRLALDDGDDNWSNFSNQATTTAAPSPLNAITGHVLDISTQGITAVQVDCWNSAEALMGTTFTLADGSGTYTVNGLPPGNYKLRVTWTVNGFSSSLWQDGIAMGSTNVDFFLNINYALATLTGTLSTLTTSSFGGAGLGVAAADSFIELHQGGREVARTTVPPGGRWTIGGLLPGTYSVRAHTSLGYTSFQDVELTEGEVKVLGFVFDPLPEASVFNFPNPARTSTTIRFETALAPLEAGIYIFDLAGNLVKEFSDSQISRAAAPVYRAVWDLNNSSGRSVAPGVYNVMVKIKGGSDNQSAKVIKKLAVVR